MGPAAFFRNRATSAQEKAEGGDTSAAWAIASAAHGKKKRHPRGLPLILNVTGEPVQTEEEAADVWRGVLVDEFGGAAETMTWTAFQHLHAYLQDTTSLARLPRAAARNAPMGEEAEQPPHAAEGHRLQLGHDGDLQPGRGGLQVHREQA